MRAAPAAVQAAQSACQPWTVHTRIAAELLSAHEQPQQLMGHANMHLSRRVLRCCCSQAQLHEDVQLCLPSALCIETQCSAVCRSTEAHCREKQQHAGCQPLLPQLCPEWKQEACCCDESMRPAAPFDRKRPEPAGHWQPWQGEACRDQQRCNCLPPTTHHQDLRAGNSGAAGVDEMAWEGQHMC